uniref:Protein kinase domain-containing protein n=1 Tax=Peronospora matthiolae TaxID=2874970 RepID=A0AAV1URS6_9STRA
MVQDIDFEWQQGLESAFVANKPLFAVSEITAKRPRASTRINNDHVHSRVIQLQAATVPHIVSYPKADEGNTLGHVRHHQLSGKEVTNEKEEVVSEPNTKPPSKEGIPALQKPQAPQLPESPQLPKSSDAPPAGTTTDSNGGLVAQGSATSISTKTHSTMQTSGGAIAGIVVGVACLVFILAAFMTRRRRAGSKRFSFRKRDSTFENSRAVSITSSKLEPPGDFGKLNSGRTESKKPNMSGLFTAAHDDPFTVRHMRKGGIWDDPVLVASRIPLEEIQIKELIARGGFGQVFTATYKGQTVAVKTLLPETAKDMDEINALYAESKILAKLDHPCIVSFIGIAWGSLSTVSCVTEYLVGGDLRALLNHFLANQTRPQGFDHDKVKIALNIAQGLAYLHSLTPNMLHRDLKSRNVLLTSQLDAKLTDFGVSRERSELMMTNAVGTSLWMAPEVMLGSHYDGKADVFSFGVLLSELDTHLMPYANVRNANGQKLTENGILQKTSTGQLQVEFSRDCPPELLRLAHACLAVNPNDRPTAAEALYKLQSALTSFEVEEVAL